MDDTRLDPVLLDFTDRRRAQKAKYHGEMFPGSTFLRFFQGEKDTTERKGIIKIDLGEFDDHE